MFGHWPLTAHRPPLQPPRIQLISLALPSSQPRLTSQFVVNVLQDDPGYLHQGQDEGSEG